MLEPTTSLPGTGWRVVYRRLRGICTVRQQLCDGWLDQSGAQRPDSFGCRTHNRRRSATARFHGSPTPHWSVPSASSTAEKYRNHSDYQQPWLTPPSTLPGRLI